MSVSRVYRPEAAQKAVGGNGSHLNPVVCPLQEIHAFLMRYLVFPSEDEPILITLWIAHTWVVDAFDRTGYLHVYSPLKQCGKTTLLDCVGYLVRNPWRATLPTAPVLFRKIEHDCPTLLLDEVDTIFNASRGDEGNKEALRAVLNAGFERRVKIPRCDGPNHALKEFSPFCPKLLAGIGNLPDTIADRSIPIYLQRKMPGQRVERFRARNVEPFAEPLRAALETWARTEGVLEQLRGARPSIPDELPDRKADISEPLLAIADIVGAEWPEMARRSLIHVCGRAASEDENTTVKLLRAIREIFADAEVDRIASRELLEKLVEREDDAPWAEWWERDIKNGNTRGPASKLAKILKPFGIVTDTIRLPDDSTLKGYKRASFQDAWNHYLLPVA